MPAYRTPTKREFEKLSEYLDQLLILVPSGEPMSIETEHGDRDVTPAFVAVINDDGTFNSLGRQNIFWESVREQLDIVYKEDGPVEMVAYLRKGKRAYFLEAPDEKDKTLNKRITKALAAWAKSGFSIDED